jgi:hypothetical protein
VRCCCSQARSGSDAKEKEKKWRGVEERGKKDISLLFSTSKKEMNILLGQMSKSKFDNKKSVYQQIAPFSASTSKGRSLSASKSKLCQFLVSDAT